MSNPEASAPGCTLEGRQQAEKLNLECQCSTLDEAKLRAELAGSAEAEELHRMLVAERPYLFAPTPVFMPSPCLSLQARIIAAIERVVALPEYQARVLTHAPRVAGFVPQAAGAFLGYDFHLGINGPKLIEINTNAGGALLNAMLPRVHSVCCEPYPGLQGEANRPGAPVEQAFVDMFLTEWRLERGDARLGRIAIVDDEPREQFLYPEFLLFRDLFQAHGIRAEIADAGQLKFRDGALWLEDRRIDLVYNRLTDFSLSQKSHCALHEAYLARAAVVTPHPRAHAVYADKRNLALLTDEQALADLGVDATTRALLQAGIAHTEVISEASAERYWSERRKLFFKPAAGFGSKAAYRGDKLTRRVFQEILKADYVAQELVLPSERSVTVGGETVRLKVDIRNFVYRTHVQSVASRMYQGQTTNLRTPGGGFAPVVVV
jgi:hypothetical protein